MNIDVEFYEFSRLVEFLIDENQMALVAFRTKYGCYPYTQAASSHGFALRREALSWVEAKNQEVPAAKIALEFPHLVRKAFCEAVMGKPPIPELEGAKPLVLYFPDDASRDAFLAIAKQAMPGLEAKNL